MRPQLVLGMREDIVQESEGKMSIRQEVLRLSENSECREELHADEDGRQ